MNYTIEVVKDACNTLNLFLGEKDLLTLTEITALTGLTKNKAFRVLATLQECGYVERMPTGAYCLHVRLLEFGNRVSRRLNLAELGGPVLAWLVDETGESAFISIVDGTMALCVAARESPSQIRLAASPGRRLPLYAGATPIILLAFMPDEHRNRLLDKIVLEPITAETITERATLEKYLTKVRKDGYVITPEDLTEGARGVGTPIRDFSGNVIASLSISGIASHFLDERVERYLSLTLEGAARISKSLGYKGQPDLDIEAGHLPSDTVSARKAEILRPDRAT